MKLTVEMLIGGANELWALMRELSTYGEVKVVIEGGVRYPAQSIIPASVASQPKLAENPAKLVRKMGRPRKSQKVGKSGPQVVREVAVNGFTHSELQRIFAQNGLAPTGAASCVQKMRMNGEIKKEGDKWVLANG